MRCGRTRRRDSGRLCLDTARSKHRRLEESVGSWVCRCHLVDDRSSMWLSGKWGLSSDGFKTIPVWLRNSLAVSGSSRF
jgi:hypothetical protein